MANGFKMNSYQTLYYEAYINKKNQTLLGVNCSSYKSDHSQLIIGVRQQGMSTLMNTIALYEHKVMQKSIAIIPRNFDSRIQLEQNLYKMTENLYIAGFRWKVPERNIDIVTKNEYRSRTDLLFVEYDCNKSDLYHPSQKTLSDRTIFFGTTEA